MLDNLCACRVWMSIALRCLLLLQPAAAVAAALPGAMTRTLSEVLTPYREHAFIPWALLNALSAPAPASGPLLQQSLGLPAMLGILSILLPVRAAAQQHAMSSSMALSQTGPPAEQSTAPAVRSPRPEHQHCKKCKA